MILPAFSFVRRAGVPRTVYAVDTPHLGGIERQIQARTDAHFEHVAMGLRNPCCAQTSSLYIFIKSRRHDFRLGISMLVRAVRGEQGRLG